MSAGWSGVGALSRGDSMQEGRVAAGRGGQAAPGGWSSREGQAGQGCGECGWETWRSGKEQDVPRVCPSPRRSVPGGQAGAVVGAVQQLSS